MMAVGPSTKGSAAAAGPAPRRTGSGVADLLLRGATAATLVVQAYVHLRDRGFYTAPRGGAVNQSTLFLLDAVATSMAATALILGWRVRIGRRADWIVAFVLAFSALGAVALYRYVNVGTIGPLPNMYEPTWQVPGKLLSAYAEGAAVVLSAVGFALKRPRNDLASSGRSTRAGDARASAGRGTLTRCAKASAARPSVLAVSAVLLLVTACSASGAPIAASRPPSPPALSTRPLPQAQTSHRPAQNNALATAASGTTTASPALVASAQPSPGISQKPAPARSLSPAPSPATSHSAQPGPPSPAKTPTPTPSSTVTAASLSIVDYAFEPKTMSVPVGTTVRATNHGQVTHTWTSKTGTWDSKNLNPGQSFSYRFTTAGVFSFVCSIHASMTGTVTVQ